MVFYLYLIFLEGFDSLIQADPDYYTFHLYPKNNGLLPIGETDNGDTLFWVVSLVNYKMIKIKS